VFLAQAELHLLPLRQVREWFLPRARLYSLKRAFTQTGAVRYTTVGAIVPVREVLEALPQAQVVRLPRAVSAPLPPPLSGV